MEEDYYFYEMFLLLFIYQVAVQFVCIEVYMWIYIEETNEPILEAVTIYLYRY